MPNNHDLLLLDVEMPEDKGEPQPVYVSGVVVGESAEADRKIIHSDVTPDQIRALGELGSGEVVDDKKE